MGWNGITKATPLKYFEPEEPNPTKPEDVLEKIVQQELQSINYNIIIFFLKSLYNF